MRLHLFGCCVDCLMAGVPRCSGAKGRGGLCVFTCGHVVLLLQGSVFTGLLHVIILMALICAFLAVYFGDAGKRLCGASFICQQAFCKLSPRTTLSVHCHQAPWTPTAPSGGTCGRSCLPGLWLTRTIPLMCPQQEAEALAGPLPFDACCPMWRRKRRHTGRGSETSGCWPRFLRRHKRMKFSHLMCVARRDEEPREGGFSLRRRV